MTDSTHLQSAGLGSPAPQLRNTYRPGIKRKTFNLLSVLVGLACTAGVWHHMATNPRWAGDTGPGVGKLPRQIVQGYLTMAYDEGKGEEAARLYMEQRTIDHNPEASDRKDGPPLKHTIKRVVAEGLNVVVWHCVEAGRGEPAQEVVDIFRTRGGRVVERIRPAAQPVESGVCPPAPDSKSTGIK